MGKRMEVTGRIDQDRRQIERAAGADDERRRITDPPLIRRGGGKLSVEQIRGNGLVMNAHRGPLESLLRP